MPLIPLFALFAETVSDEAKGLGGIILFITALFGYLRRRETRKIRELEYKDKKREAKIGEQDAKIATLEKEVMACHAERDLQNGTINRLELWRIESLQKENDLHRRVDELEKELERHRQTGRHRK